MKKAAIMAIAIAFILISGTFGFALAEEGQSGQMGNMMSGQNMMGDQNMMGHNMEKHHHMKRECNGRMGMMNSMSMFGLMNKSIVPTEDGGVVVMIGNKLYKYDKNLKLKKEAEIKIDYEGLRNMMMKMQNTCNEMYQKTPSKLESNPSQGRDEK